MRIPTITVVGPAVHAAALLLAFALPLAAQNISARPTYGTLDLTAGFRPDPQVISISAGGSHRSELAGCDTYIHAAAPDVDINYDSGSLPLTISATSSSDVVLLVNTPDGRWHCDDDSGPGTNPTLVFASPLSGNYNVWVGTYSSQSGNLPPAQLQVTELGGVGGASNGSSGSAELDWSAPPTYGTIDLSGGFSPDPFTQWVAAGGADAVPDLGPGCRGYVNATAPDLDLDFEAGSLPLNIYVRSDTDVTLIVNQPDGSWICSDDADGSNPHIRLERPQSGTYNIWIGTYAPSSAPLPESTLYISELSPDW